MIRSAPNSASNSVAIVGIGCRFPGGVSDPDSFWRLLEDGGDAIGDMPDSRMDIGRYYSPEPVTPGHMMTRRGGFLDGIDMFDAGFFGISPREAERLDPQQRLLLECAWEALEDAGQDLHRLDVSRSGVFVGQWVSDFESRLFADPAAIDFLMTTGSGRYAASGRLSYALGFRGPSLTIDTACSSSLAAVHLAVRSIRAGESRIALAGGVNVILQPYVHIAYSQSRMMAADGRCKFGDASGDGYVRSEGAGLVVLKALDEAVADGDRVYAVIRGSALNNDGGSSGSLGRPSRIGQQELLRTAYDDAGLSPLRVGYVEAHGTGTRVGDPVELAAVATVLGEGRDPGRPVYIGSVKTNIGHTEGAAGIAGLIKATLALRQGVIPPSLHCDVPNPAIPWSDIPCMIARTLVPWRDDGDRRVAGVSGYGIAGTNGHVVLEAADPPARAQAKAGGRQLKLLPLSARGPEALRALAGRYADLMTGHDAPALGDLCWSAAMRRTALSHRAAFVAGDPAAMAEQLRHYAVGGPASAEGVVRAAAGPKLGFVLPGQGAQWIGMARQLLALEPAFRAALEQCDQAASAFIDWSIIEQLAAEPGSKDFRLDRIDVIQPVLAALAIAYAALLRSFGVVPDAVVGHSMGEVAAACIAGVLDLGQAMQVICRRSALMRRVSGQGAMAMVDLSIDALRPRLAGLEDRVAVAASNGPRSSVISGHPDAVRQVMAGLENDLVFSRLIKVDVASHSPQMAPLAAELGAELATMRPGQRQMPIYSTVLGRTVEGDELGAAYWARNMREPVLFATAIDRMAEDGIAVFLELGPHPILLPSVQQIAPAATTVACGRREEPEPAAILTALGALWTAGYALDWHRVMLQGGATVRLPLYPWQRQRYWAEAAELQPVGVGAGGTVRRPDMEVRAWLHRLEWKELPSLPAERQVASSTSWLVLTDDQAVGQTVTGALTREAVEVRVAPISALESELGRQAHAARPLDGVIVMAGDGPDAGYLPLRALQACLASGARFRPRLWFVTRGAQYVEADQDRPVSIDQAALWGAARVVAEEHPELWGGLIDFDPAEPPSAIGAALSQELPHQDGEDQIAWRRGSRYALRLAPADQDPIRTARAWREDAAYLITGGLGGVGQHVARAMAAAGARRLILMGRTALPPRRQWAATAPASELAARIAVVRALEAMGVAVHTPAVDVGDAAALRAFLDAYAAEGWPPIRGVFHAAGTMQNGLAGSMDRAAFDGVLGGKLRAAQALDRLLPDLDHFVLFSSITAFLPHAGIANYAAANAGLDALAQARRARGSPALSIGWGPWNSGMALGEAAQRAVGEMARQGIQPIPPERGAALFAWLCGQPGPTYAVMPADWTRFRSARSGRSGRLFQDITAGSGTGSPGVTGEPSDFLDRLAAADNAERRRLVEGVTKDAVARVLKLAPDRIDKRMALGSMGLTSLLAIELRNRLETVLQRPLSATLAWNYPTVEAMAGHLTEEPANLPSNIAPDPAVAGMLADVATMSEEDVMLALLKQPAAAE